MNDKIIEQLTKSHIHHKTNVSIKPYTTLNIGGMVKYLVEPKTAQEMLVAFDLAKKHNVKMYVLGKGSNVLFSDEGYDGMVIVLSTYFNKIWREGDSVHALSGATLKEISDFCIEEGLAGFEFASGIPGTIGGGVVMNAGAYGKELKDVVSDVIFIDEAETISTLNNEELEFSYRHSYFTNRDCVVLKVILDLSVGRKDKIRKEVDYLSRLRENNQPLDDYSVGSTFKRPDGGIASKIINDLELKGMKVGDAEVSLKHSGFLVNRGQATSEEYLQLVEDVITKVYKETGYMLEREFKIVEK